MFDVQDESVAGRVEHLDVLGPFNNCGFSYCTRSCILRQNALGHPCIIISSFSMYPFCTLTLFVFDLLCCSDILCGSGWAIKYWYNIMLAFDHAFAYRER